MKSLDLSISLISFKNKELLENCLDSIYLETQLKMEILLVDNASKDGTVQMVKKKFPKVKLIENKKNLIFTKAHNQNLKRAAGKYFLVLNEDTYIPKGALSKMVKFMENNKDAGLASCIQKDQNGKVDTTCSRLPHPFLEIFESNILGRLLVKIGPFWKIEKKISHFRYSSWTRNSTRKVEVIPGSFFMGKKELLEEVGLFDENMLLFYEEPDYCQRAKEKGFYTYHVGNVKIIHLKSKALSKLSPFLRFQISEHDMLAYYRKYFGFFWWLVLWIVYRPNWIYWRIKN